MILPHPWLLAVAALLALAGLGRLFVPPRRRVEVATLILWRAALDQVGRQRRVRRPRAWMVLAALGIAALVGSAGGLAHVGERPAPPPVLVVVSNSPHLRTTDAEGRMQADRLLGRLDELFDLLDERTPVRLAVVGGRGLGVVQDASAGQWSGRRAALVGRLSGLDGPADLDAALRAWRRPTDGPVFVLGHFAGEPTARPGVEHIFQPAPPGEDVGLIAAAAERIDGRVELFVAVRRFAGAVRAADLLVLNAAGRQIASARAEPDRAGRAGVLVDLPGDLDGPITVRLAEPDDQPLNDALRLVPAAGEGRATAQLIGRPDDAIRRAIRASGRLTEWHPGAGRADWLIVNEPAAPVQPAADQSAVFIDPLVPPPGVRLTGVLSNAEMISFAAPRRPWSLSSESVVVRRASRAVLDGRWAVLASDAAGHPLIAWQSAARQMVILFSVAAENTDFSERVSWPVFWNGLGELVPAGADARPNRWAAPLEPILPPEAFDPPDAERARAVNAARIEPPPPADRPTARATWALLAGLGAVLLAAGWAWPKEWPGGRWAVESRARGG